MLVTGWSVKGGVGTTVVAASLAVLLSRRHPAGALLVDADGDLPSVLGLPRPDGPGLAELTTTTPDAPADRLARLEIPVDDHLSLVPRGEGDLDPAALPAVAEALLLDARPVVVDAGLLGRPGDDRRTLAGAATTSVLVLRPCYLALRRALDAPVRPTGTVVVDEPGRSLDAADVHDVLGVPVLARLRWDPAVARAVDAGVLAQRLPRHLARHLASVA